MFLNDHEPYCADWLRNLFLGATVDDRSILSVEPADLVGHARVHLFAGIGGWEYALQLAGWPDDEPIWTASLPCQPFSAAGRHAGVRDERHLWPAVHRLIAECRPPVIVGEQVASKAGRHWLAGIRHDLEDLGYAVGAADMCAASVGAPHIRQRLFWVADARYAECKERPPAQEGQQLGRGDAWGQPASCGDVMRLAESAEGRRRRRTPDGEGEFDGAQTRRNEDAGIAGGGRVGLGDAAQRGFGIAGSAPGHARHADEPDEIGRMGHPILPGREASGNQREREGTRPAQSADSGSSGGMAHADESGQHERPSGWEQSLRDIDDETRRVDDAETTKWRRPRVGAAQDRRSGFWDDAVWLPCLDGKARRTQPGLHPLAHGVPARASKLRAYGNAIVPQAAAEFLMAYREVRNAQG